MRVLLVLSMCLVACIGSLTAADRAKVATNAATLEGCQEVGRACKVSGGKDCFSKYDACVTDAGLR